MDSMLDLLNHADFRFYSTLRMSELEKQLCEGHKALEALPSLESLKTLSDPAVLLTSSEEIKNKSFCEALIEGFDPLALRVIFLGHLSEWTDAGLPIELLYSILPPSARCDDILFALKSLCKMSEAQNDIAALQGDLDQHHSEMDRVLAISQELVAQEDLDSLLRLMVNECMSLTGADAGSLFLVDQFREKPTQLQFRIAQTRSLVEPKSYEVFTLPLNRKSIAGYVALSGEPLLIEDVYALESDLGLSFDQSYDQKQGYRTKSMLAVPLIDHRKRVIGVLQLINAKHNSSSFRDLQDLENRVKPFTPADQNLVMAVAGQAAVAIENRWLYSEIENLFASFVTASVTAIESRDPSTSGHSFRVADYTELIAKAVDNSCDGTFSNRHFSQAQLRELRYASLLHDFGKVGVRESVLTKPKKLSDLQGLEIQSRFRWLRKDLELRHLKGETVQLTLEQLDHWFQLVMRANEPSLLPKEMPDHLHEMMNIDFEDWTGARCLLLSKQEVEILSIRKGSLTPEEWDDMQSHVLHTRNFLNLIPWTGDLAAVPEIATCHHEKLDGSGYPDARTEATIPYASRIMTISDIFDALTASDRHYKKAVPVDKALQILEFEAKDGHIDRELLDLFISRRIYADVLSKTAM